VQEPVRVLGLCRWLYNTPFEQPSTAWQRCHVSVSRYQQEAELEDIRVAMAEYAAIHSHVLQDVLARLDKTYRAFFRRVRAGEKAGFQPRRGPMPQEPSTRLTSLRHKRFVVARQAQERPAWSWRIPPIAR
jgi:putative transposase